MRVFVSTEVARRAKTPITTFVVTDVWLDSCMRLHVLTQSEFAIEALGTTEIRAEKPLLFRILSTIQDIRVERDRKLEHIDNTSRG